jgi:bacterioferritin-associated ferredoxin
VFVCNCFGVTEDEVRQHVGEGACTPRQIASASKAGTDCGSCVRHIQALLGRSGCPRREFIDQGRPALVPDPALAATPAPVLHAGSAPDADTALEPAAALEPALAHGVAPPAGDVLVHEAA